MRGDQQALLLLALGATVDTAMFGDLECKIKGVRGNAVTLEFTLTDGNGAVL